MDGTLVDSTVAVESVWSAWAERNSIPTADVLAWCHGRNVAATITHFLPHITPETLQSMVSAQLDQECTARQRKACGRRPGTPHLARRPPHPVGRRHQRAAATSARPTRRSHHRPTTPGHPRGRRAWQAGARRLPPWSPLLRCRANPSVGRGGLCVRPRGSTQRRHRSRGCRRTQGCRRRMSRPCRPAPPTRPDTFQVA